VDDARAAEKDGEDGRGPVTDPPATDVPGPAEPVVGGDAGAEAVEARLEEARAEMDALRDRHLRLAAEFDNYRKRIDRERSELRGRAQAELVRDLLDAIDDLQRVSGYAAESAAAGALSDGVDLVQKKLLRALESAGLETIEARGEPFDPTSMEALATVPAAHPEEDDVVAEVFQKGYRYQGLLVRPARVQVKKYQD
jgi:molecular chaperone GrpE